MGKGIIPLHVQIANFCRDWELDEDGYPYRPAGYIALVHDFDEGVYPISDVDYAYEDYPKITSDDISSAARAGAPWENLNRLEEFVSEYLETNV